MDKQFPWTTTRSKCPSTARKGGSVRNMLKGLNPRTKRKNEKKKTIL